MLSRTSDTSAGRQSPHLRGNNAFQVRFKHPTSGRITVQSRLRSSGWVSVKSRRFSSQPMQGLAQRQRLTAASCRAAPQRHPDGGIPLAYEAGFLSGIWSFSRRNASSQRHVDWGLHQQKAAAETGPERCCVHHADQIKASSTSKNGGRRTARKACRFGRRRAPERSPR